MELLGILFCIFFAIHDISGYMGDQRTVRKNGGKTESDLRRDLFQNYDKLVRPIQNPSNAVPSWIGMAPLSIRELSEETEVLVMDSWLMMKWRDDYLQWDPESYNGIETLNLPSSEVWKPDLTLYTASSDTAYFPKVLTQVLLNHTGDVLWVPPFSVNSRCPLEISKLPKKSQMCNLKIGSWTYSGRQLDLQKYSEDVDISNFQDTNPDWQLLGVTSDRQSKHYPCCPDEYPSVNFNVTLRRRASSSYKDRKQGTATVLAYMKSFVPNGKESGQM